MHTTAICCTSINAVAKSATKNAQIKLALKYFLVLRTIELIGKTKMNVVITFMNCSFQYIVSPIILTRLRV
jgi:hypothetical protein